MNFQKFGHKQNYEVFVSMATEWKHKMDIIINTDIKHQHLKITQNTSKSHRAAYIGNLQKIMKMLLFYSPKY